MPIIYPYELLVLLAVLFVVFDVDAEMQAVHAEVLTLHE